LLRLSTFVVPVLYTIRIRSSRLFHHDCDLHLTCKHIECRQQFLGLAGEVSTKSILLPLKYPNIILTSKMAWQHLQVNMVGPYCFLWIVRLAGHYISVVDK